jgi:hypothetical protein
VLKKWFNVIRTFVPDWWDKGSNPGGGLAMNDGVTTCVNAPQRFQHLNTERLVRLDNEDVFESTKIYANALGEYFASLSEDQRKGFRDLRGGQGQITRTRRCQQAIRERIPTFNPPKLDEFLELEKAQTNRQAKEIIDRIETTLQKVVLEELRREITGPDESQWWMDGVPKLCGLRWHNDWKMTMVNGAVEKITLTLLTTGSLLLITGEYSSLYWHMVKLGTKIKDRLDGIHQREEKNSISCLFCRNAFAGRFKPTSRI